MSFSLTFTMEYLAFLYFCDPALVLKTREVINPFPDIPNFPFDSEDVILILSRLSNFDEMSKVTYLSLPLIYLFFFKLTYLSLPLISLCFLTVWRPKSFMSTARKFFPYLWNFPPITSSEWSNQDKYTVVLQLLGASCQYCENYITKLWAHRS